MRSLVDNFTMCIHLKQALRVLEGEDLFGWQNIT